MCAWFYPHQPWTLRILRAPVTAFLIGCSNAQHCSNVSSVSTYKSLQTQMQSCALSFTSKKREPMKQNVDICVL